MTSNTNNPAEEPFSLIPRINPGFSNLTGLRREGMRNPLDDDEIAPAEDRREWMREPDEILPPFVVPATTDVLDFATQQMNEWSLLYQYAQQFKREPSNKLAHLITELLKKMNRRSLEAHNFAKGRKHLFFTLVPVHAIRQLSAAVNSILHVEPDVATPQMAAYVARVQRFFEESPTTKNGFMHSSFLRSNPDTLEEQDEKMEHVVKHVDELFDLLQKGGDLINDARRRKQSHMRQSVSKAILEWMNN